MSAAPLSGLASAMNDEKRNLHWLPQWAPTIAVVVTMLAAAFYVVGELARLDQGQVYLTQGQADLTQGQADLRAEMASLETRLETRMEALFRELRGEFAALPSELREDRREFRTAISKVQDDIAAVSERVAVLEAARES